MDSKKKNNIIEIKTQIGKVRFARNMYSLAALGSFALGATCSYNAVTIASNGGNELLSAFLCLMCGVSVYSTSMFAGKTIRKNEEIKRLIKERN